MDQETIYPGKYDNIQIKKIMKLANNLKQEKLEDSSWELRKKESKYRAEFLMNWDGKKIKMFRQLLGISQNEFCCLIGIHQATLSNYEKGRTIGDTELMKKIEKVCNEWKEKKLKSLHTEMEFIKSF